MTNTTTPMLSPNDLVAGAAAEGQGALTGWRGQGSMPRAEILAVLAEAGLPAEWAPRSQSAVAYAGRAVEALNGRGYVARRARALTKGETRTFRARWVVARALADQVDVGDQVGTVVLSVELREGSDELVLEGDANLAQSVRDRYEADRAGEVYEAADVTAWAAWVLAGHAGAVSFGVGYYVPALGRDVAARLVGALSLRWGRAWIYPLLPVATSDELKVGIARSLSEDVAVVRRALDAGKVAAAERGEAAISTAVAARLLADLTRVEERLAAFRPLCGDAAAPVVAEVAALRATLEPLCDDAAQRFALIGADLPAQVPARRQARGAVSPAERAAEQALAKRLAGAPLAAPAPREVEPSDSAERFAMLDLDLPVESPVMEEVVEAQNAELVAPELAIAEDNGNYLVTTPYVAASLAAWKQLPGRRWDKARKVNVVPKTAREQLWSLLKTFYRGRQLRTQTGAMVTL